MNNQVPTPPPSPAPVLPSFAGPAPLTPEQVSKINQAARTHRALRRAARTALSSSGTTLLIGAVSALCAAFSPDWKNVTLSLAILAVGSIEYVGQRRLLRADRGAPRLLMRNQLAFLGVIVAYCMFQMLTFSTDALKKEAVSPEFREQLHQLPQMEKSMDAEIDKWGALTHFALYGSLILVSILFQGGLAWYYATRSKHVEAFHRANPAWAKQIVTRLAA